jgi:peptidyl-prolyl cis-trans isomerase D
MLSFFRQELKSFHWVLWLVIASFVVGFVFILQGTGGSSGGGSAPSEGDWAARVGSETISARQFLDAFARQEEGLRRLFGDQYDRARFIDPNAVLGQLVDRALLKREAGRLGLDVTPREIATAIRRQEAFKGPDGRFDRALYDGFLRGNRLDPLRFEEQLAEDLLVGKVLDLLRASVAVSGAELREEWLRRNETVTLEYVLVASEGRMADAAPSEEELRAWFDAHASDYDGGPARLVRWVLFDRAAIQASLEDEAGMRAYYQENLPVIYTMGPDQRRASRILVAVPPAADEGLREAARAEAAELLARARAGEDFAALARAESDDPFTRDAGGDLGPFYRGVHGDALDEAVFAAAEGELVGPVETERGFDVLLVTKGEGEKARSFEDVRDSVARGLYAARSEQAARDLLARFQEAYSQAPDLDAAARAVGLTAADPEWVTAGQPIAGLGTNPELTARAFATLPGQVTEPLPAATGQVVLAVVDTRETSPRSFEDAREAVEADVRAERALALAREEAERLRQAAETDGLAAAAGERPVATAGPVRRGQAFPALGPEPALSRAAFETPVGELGPVTDVEQGAVVFRVSDRVSFDAARFAADRETLRQSVEQQRFGNLQQATLDSLRKRHEDEIAVNPAVLAPFLG